MKKILFLFILLILTGCTSKTKEALILSAEDTIYVGDEITITSNLKIDLHFSSSNNNFATVNSEGILKAISAGKVIITGVSKNDETIKDEININIIDKEIDVVDIEITSNDGYKLYITEQLQLAVNPVPSDASVSLDVEWSVNDTNIATIDDTGLLTGLHEGKATVTAVVNGITKNVVIEIVKKDELKIIGYSELYVEDEIPYLVESLIGNENLEVIWSSSDENIAKFTEYGLLALEQGKVTITARLVADESIFATLEITILEYVHEVIIEGESDLVVNDEIQLIASVFPEYVSQEVTWTSSNEEILKVDQNGKVLALKEGVAKITATSVQDNSVKAVMNITVYPLPESIEIEPVDNLYVNGSAKLIASVYPLSSNQNVIWSSSNDDVATVSDEGLVSAIAPGKVTITATSLTTPSIKATIVIIIDEPQESEYYQTKVLSIDKLNYKLELLDVPATNYMNASVKILRNGNLINGSINDLYLGMTNVYVKANNQSNTIESILIDGDTGFNDIRVAIRNSIGDISNDATLFHDRINILTQSNTVLQTFDGLEKVFINAGAKVSFVVNNNQIRAFINSDEVMSTSKRVILIPNTLGTQMEVNSITRNGRYPEYEGNLEISIVNNRLLLINDVNLEAYLTKVVPSEMPASYNDEALKAQAIAARTYAYMDILRRTKEHYGYTVDDSTSSQVYNNQDPATAATNAVYNTKGLIMMSNGEPIQAYYYSTGAGLSASGHEVWINNGPINPIPYLMGKNLSTTSSGQDYLINTASEASMLAFFKDRAVHHPDESISFQRWKVNFTPSQLERTLNINLKNTYNATPESVQTKSGSSWISKTIPSDIGTVNNIYVSDRGSSGVVMSIVIETSTGAYKIWNQYNIRFTLRPNDADTDVYRAKYNSNYAITNSSILYSGFFAIDYESNGSYSFYGGGNGHGVGMSQNGANSLGKSGMNYNQILTSYYSNIDLTDITYNYNSLNNFEDYLK